MARSVRSIKSVGKELVDSLRTSAQISNWGQERLDLQGGLGPTYVKGKVIGWEVNKLTECFRDLSDKTIVIVKFIPSF